MQSREFAELITKAGREKGRAFTELWDTSRMCTVEENYPGVRGAGEASSDAQIIAVWVFRMMSRKVF